MSLVFAITFFFYLIGGGVLRHSAVQTDFEFEISGPLVYIEIFYFEYFSVYIEIFYFEYFSLYRDFLF